ncbi:MAG: squalene synthase HpnC [Burkholderiales bacterium]|nr:squalene synthase HpnC [Burkholderiales bacterium]
MSVGHYENFPVASLLLPARLRAPVRVIYRFARSADDFADEGDAPPDERLARLQAYRHALDEIAAGRTPADALFDELAGIVAAHRLPLAPFYDLLAAFAQDVTKTRYADFAELLEYCRRSANPVGRLLLHLFGRASPQNLRDSDAICSGLQLANFWQDVALDWTRQRVYLPRDEMARFGVAEAQIAEARCDGAWRALIGFQIERTRAMLLAGAPLGRRLGGRIGLEIRLTVQGGLRILDKLAAAGADMFRHRPVLRGLDWPLLVARAL